MKKFIFEVSVSHILDIDQIWPDGGAPENPTAEDARQAFLDCCQRGVADGLSEWNLGPEEDDLVVVEVTE